MSNPILGYRKVSLLANQEKVAPFSGARMVRFFNASGNFSIQINGGTWIPMTRGLRVLLKQGDLIEELNIKDTSGDANDVELYFGDVDVADDTLNVVGIESVTISGNIESITNPVNVANFPATQEVRPEAASVTLNGSSFASNGNNLTGKRWVRVTNTHGSSNITVSINSISKTLAPGEVYETPQLDQGESLPTVTVNASGASADAEFLDA